MSIRDVYIVDAVRTPVGKFGGALSAVRPDDLAAHVVKALVDRTPDLDPSRIDDVYFGDANGAGEDNRDVARMAVLLAGLPVSVPGVTVNRLCGSGLEAVIQAARAIALGDASVAVAGGVESMSRAPWVVQKPERAFPAGHQQMHSTTLGWRMTNPRMPQEWTVALGEGAELVADRHGITRAQQDAFALASHGKAAAAWDAGLYDGEVVPYDGATLSRDECIRAGSSMDALAGLKPVFRAGGTVTAGNASRSTTARRRCCSSTTKGCGPPAVNPSPVSGRRQSPESSRSSSGSARWKRSGGPWRRRARVSVTSPPSN